MRFLTIITTLLLTIPAAAQRHLQQQTSSTSARKTFTTLKGESDNQREKPVSQRHLLGLRHAGVSGE